jgi:hypothetical protein
MLYKDSGLTSIEIMYGEWVNGLSIYKDTALLYFKIYHSTLLKKIELFF